MTISTVSTISTVVSDLGVWQLQSGKDLCLGVSANRVWLVSRIYIYIYFFLLPVIGSGRAGSRYGVDMVDMVVAYIYSTRYFNSSSYMHILLDSLLLLEQVAFQWQLSIILK